MFKDTEEELERLESALLEQEEPTSEEPPVAPEAFADDDTAPDCVTDFEAYNNDAIDEDLDAYSEQVYEGKQEKNVVLYAVLFALLTGILCVFGWWVLRYSGVL